MDCNINYSLNPAVHPSSFIEYAERKLGRALTVEERDAVVLAREESEGKRAGVKAMRVALEGLISRPL